MKSLLRCCLFVAVLGCAAPLAVAKTDPFAPLRQMPVLHDGRIMPFETYCREVVDAICDTTSPYLRLKGAIPAAELQSSDYDAAKLLFPGDEPRRWDAVELVFSWLTEPNAWEEVPFLLAEHDVLREELLDVPVLDEEGKHLKYVSPRQVRDAAAFQAKVEELGQQQRGMAPPESDGLDKKVFDLVRAYRLFRQVSFSGQTVVTEPVSHFLAQPSRFLERLQATVQTYAGLREPLGGFGEFGSDFEQAADALFQITKLADEAIVPVDQAEKPIRELLAAAESLELKLKSFRSSALAQSSEGTDAAVNERALSQVRQFLVEAELLHRQAQELWWSLYDNAFSMGGAEFAPRFLPAMNPYALEAERKQEDEAQPWMALPMLMHGSDAVLANYDQPGLERARDAWNMAAETYQAARAKSEFGDARTAQALQDFSNAVDGLGRQIEAARRKLPIQQPDEGLLEYTRYPDSNVRLQAELTYNALQPFKWSWIIFFVSLVLLTISLGLVRGPLFWSGTALLLAAAGISAYGLYLRSIVTGWAPVTDMYTTLIYVPVFTAILATWFTILPLVWPGLQNAWRLTAVPASWEATELTSEQREFAQPSTWGLANMFCLLPRAALMAVLIAALTMKPYAAGGRTIINWLPNQDLGEKLPDANDLITWFVGLCVLVPTAWYLPRALTALALTPFTLRRSWRGKGAELARQTIGRWPFAWSGALVGFLISAASHAPFLDPGFSPLMPVLRDNFWLLIHVLTIVSSYGAGFLAWGVGNLALAWYAFGRYETVEVAELLELPPGHRPAQPAAAHVTDRPVYRPPVACNTLANFCYRATQVAVLLLFAGTILGGLWADVSWGRFWGWDPKEVWALISGLVYIAILHGRYAGWFGNFGLCVGSVLGWSAIVFSWYGVNFVLGAGLHSYGFGEGGQLEIALVAIANWTFVGVAAVRYRALSGGSSDQAADEDVAEEDEDSQQPQNA